MRKVTFAIAAIAVAACSDTSSRVTSPLLHPESARATLIATDGNPAPGASDRLIVDTRTSLQGVTTLAQAEALFRGNDHTPARSAAGGLGWSFVKNFDGAGTNALRADWPSVKKCSDQTNRIIDYLPDPLPKSLYVQWKTRFGRHPNDAGGNGNANAYTIENSACPTASAFAMNIFRDDDGDRGALTLGYDGRSLATAGVYQDALGNDRSDPNEGWTFAPSQAGGRTVKFTMYIQAESAPRARDGIVRVWVDGRLYFEKTNLAIGTQPIGRFEFPGWRFGTIAESEYIWDVVAWASNPPAVAKIAVTPASSSIGLGKQVQLSATGYDAGGGVAATGAINWSSSDDKVAKVDNDGTVTGRKAGSVTITASNGKFSGTAAITVVAPVPTSIAVTPTSATIKAHDKVQLSATILDAAGDPMKGDVKWTSADKKIARVDDDGTVRGVSDGTVQITATSGKLSASATITVDARGRKHALDVTLAATSLLIGQTTQATAKLETSARFAGAALPHVTWSSSNTGVATVSSTGVVTAVSPGSADIIAKDYFLDGQATVTVASSGAPSPGAGQTIVIDSRKTLPNANSITDAFAMFAMPNGDVDRTPDRGARNVTSGWSFTANADGSGLHALRADWSNSADPCPDPGCHDEGIRVIHYLPNGSDRGGTPTTDLWLQWNNRLGRFDADADANGDPNSYAIYPQSNSCKRALVSHEDGTKRVDFTLTRPDPGTPEGARLEVDDQNWSINAPTDKWNMTSVTGANTKTYTTTMHVKAAAPGTTNGLVELWIDNTLIISRNDVPMGDAPFDRWEIPTICTSVPQPQAEYFWNILVWKNP